MLNVSVIESAEKGNAAYGLEILTEDGRKLIYSEISANSEAVRELADNLTADDISLDHIDDIIRDFIIGESYDKLILNNMI